jgi:hypothetical protein
MLLFNCRRKGLRHALNFSRHSGFQCADPAIPLLTSANEGLSILQGAIKKTAPKTGAVCIHKKHF